ncbi:hypothetical protein WMY93_027225 [Mugilogobius chulae]|uniref:Amino acid transporter transmembrane domain-containing protein n=1 Tax=Mugilogobius chulae TaxID=88201 RepID=A0AAW0MY75_9GOBI
MELQKFANGTQFHEPSVEGGMLPEEERFLPHKPDSKTPQFTDFEGKTSFGMSVFNLSNAIMGSGILGLSYAMSNTGIVLFLILLTCIAGLSCYSVHLLLKSAGWWGSGLIITLHNIGAMSSYLFIVNTDDWFMNGNYLIVIVTVGIILPLALMKHLGYLGYTSGFSLSCMVFFLSAVIYKKDMCTAKFFTINSQTAYTVPILAFAFVCHPEVLPIYTELKNPTKTRMQRIGNVSILGMFTMYFFTAIFGYLTYYGNTEPELLHTYSLVDPLDTLILCVRLAVLVAVTLTVPVVLFPIRRALLQLLFPEKPFHWCRHVSIAVCLLFAVNLLVIFVPNIRDIFGITGATTAPASSSSSQDCSTSASSQQNRNRSAPDPRSWPPASPLWASSL